jgi:hypothetical protein
VVTFPEPEREAYELRDHPINILFSVVVFCIYRVTSRIRKRPEQRYRVTLLIRKRPEQRTTDTLDREPTRLRRGGHDVDLIPVGTLN